MRQVNMKTDVVLFVFDRWDLYMWTTAQMLRTMDFVFHRVMAVAQRGSTEMLLQIYYDLTFCF